MPPKPSVRRYEDLKLIYDLDFPNRTLVLRQRVYKTESGNIQTPITPLALARRYQGLEKIPAAREFEPRYIEACFINPDNREGESNLKAIIPYRPTNDNLKLHIREILSYDGVQTGFYFSEQHITNVARYFKG